MDGEQTQARILPHLLGGPVVRDCRVGIETYPPTKKKERGNMLNNIYRNDFIRAERKLVIQGETNSQLVLQPDNPGTDAVAYLELTTRGKRAYISLDIDAAGALRDALTILIKERA